MIFRFCNSYIEFGKIFTRYIPSVGGMLSLATTSMCPERIRSVIIIGATCAVLVALGAVYCAWKRKYRVPQQYSRA